MGFFSNKEQLQQASKLLDFVIQARKNEIQKHKWSSYKNETQKGYHDRIVQLYKVIQKLKTEQDISKIQIHKLKLNIKDKYIDKVLELQSRTLKQCINGQSLMKRQLQKYKNLIYYMDIDNFKQDDQGVRKCIETYVNEQKKAQQLLRAIKHCVNIDCYIAIENFRNMKEYFHGEQLEMLKKFSKIKERNLQSKKKQGIQIDQIQGILKVINIRKEDQFEYQIKKYDSSITKLIQPIRKRLQQNQTLNQKAEQLYKIKRYCKQKLGLQSLNQLPSAQQIFTLLSYLDLINKCISDVQPILPSKCYPTLPSQNIGYNLWFRIAAILNCYIQKTNDNQSKNWLQNKQKHIREYDCYQDVEAYKQKCEILKKIMIKYVQIGVNNMQQKDGNKILKYQDIKSRKQDIKISSQKCENLDYDKKIEQLEKNIKERQEHNKLISQRLQKQTQKVQELSTTLAKSKPQFLSIQNKNKQYLQTIQQLKSLSQSNKSINAYSTLLNGGSLLNPLSATNNLNKQQALALKQKVSTKIQMLCHKKIVQTQLIYSFPKLSISKVNFHKYFDNQPNLLLLISLKNSKQIIGAFTQSPITQQQQTNKSMQGILFNYHRDRFYTINRQNQSSKVVLYNQYFIIFGNSEIRIKQGEDEVYSNFGIINKYFDTHEDTLSDFWGSQDQKQKIQQYQIHRIFFQS